MPLPTFTRETDYFALAIHIFKLLMNGYTPFGGIQHSVVGSPPFIATGNEEVLAGNYVFKPGFKPPKKATIPRLETFPQKIADLFTRAFIAGWNDPKQRPTAYEWHGALEQYEKELIQCSDNPLHQYDRKNGKKCPYCDHLGVVPPPPPSPSPPRIGRHSDISAKDNGYTPLHIAIDACDYNTVASLVSRGVDVNAVDKSRPIPPLYLAVHSGRIEVVKLLISHGADVNAKKSQNLTCPALDGRFLPHHTFR